MNKIRGSISLRLAFMFSLTFSVGITSAFLIAYFQVRYSLEKSAREVLVAKHREAATILTTEGMTGLQSFESAEANRISNASFMVRVLSENGETVYLKPSVQEENFDFDKAFTRQLHPEILVGWGSIPAIDDEDVFNLYTEKINSQYYLQIGRSSEERGDILEKILGVFGAVGGFFILISAAMGLWYAKRALLPLRDMVSTIGRLEKGDLSHRVPVAGQSDELAHLGESFNRMISRVERLIQIMRDSLDSVAHDIRTPLTRIRAVAEDALISKNQPSLTSALEDCAEAATNISEMVDQWMSISEADSGTLQLRLEHSDVTALLKEVVEIYEFVAQEKNIGVEFSTATEDLRWTFDRKRMAQAVANLVDNALKFSPAGTSVSIEATQKNDQSGAHLLITVKDHGPGIPTADLKRIWDRLFRGDKSRSTRGAGLGLAIVRSIVQAHGGEVSVQSEPGAGSIFSILLPVVDQPRN